MSLLKPKVLVVDDEPHIVNLLHLVLENDYDVYDAYTGIEAVNLASEVRPDIILLDTMMPGMDGYQVAMHLRSLPQTRNIPIVMLAARNRMADKFRIIRAGADDAIVKPFEPKDVKKRIQHVIGRHEVVI